MRKRWTEKGIAGDRQDTKKRGIRAGSGGPHSIFLRITTRHRPLAPTVTCARGRVMPANCTGGNMYILPQQWLGWPTWYRDPSACCFYPRTAGSQIAALSRQIFANGRERDRCSWFVAAVLVCHAQWRSNASPPEPRNAHDYRVIARGLLWEGRCSDCVLRWGLCTVGRAEHQMHDTGQESNIG
jgi:hypothetical protein